MRNRCGHLWTQSTVGNTHRVKEQVVRKDPDTTAVHLSGMSNQRSAATKTVLMEEGGLIRIFANHGHSICKFQQNKYLPVCQPNQRSHWQESSDHCRNDMTPSLPFLIVKQCATLAWHYFLILLLDCDTNTEIFFANFQGYQKTKEK